MKLKKWLTVKANGTARITMRRPALEADEIAIQLQIVLPDALFNKPKLQASITIPEEAAAVETINAMVSDNVKEAIEQATGLEFAVSIVRAEEDAA